MKLSVKDRLMLLSVLPQQDTLVNMRLVDQISRELELTPEEVKACSLRHTPDGRPQWDGEKDFEKSVTIEEPVMLIIIRELEKLNDAKQLTRDHLCLADKFLQDDED